MKTTTDDIIIDADRPRQGLDLRELWRYRDLFYVLARRDIAVRYKQTALGALWAILQPLFTMLIFTVVFGRFARMPSDGIPYSLFAFAGLLPWMFFANAFGASGNSIISSSRLVKKVYFPRLIIPISAIGASLVDLLISTAFMFLLMAYNGYTLSINVLWLPCLYLLAAITAAGVGTLIAALSVAYRDFRHVLHPMITVWMFMTPVIYPPSLIPEQWRALIFLNPMAGVIDAIRSAWFDRPFDMQAIGISAAMSFLILWIGITYFRSVEKSFADII